jgi:nucleoside-diphosphate-sugar epimerase
MQLLVIGLGYAGHAIADAARRLGWGVSAISRAAPGAIPWEASAAIAAVRAASHIVATVPPEAGGDPVLDRFGPHLAGRWLCYLSSTGVYGDAGGAWVDEASPIIGHGADGRRSSRAEADIGWQAMGACVLRLPGIYGPGRSVFDQIRAGTARRVDRPGHRFSRIHVADIAGAVVAAAAARLSGVFNLTDDVPAEPRALVEQACRLLGAAPPPLVALEAAGLSPVARAFWSERRLVAGSRFQRATGYRLRYPDYRAGLAAIRAAMGDC